MLNLSSLSKKKNNEDFVYFSISPDGDMREKVFSLFPDGSFIEEDIVYVRVDNVTKEPLKILVNDSEWSVTINDSIGILFKDEFAVEEFLEEIYFVMEELNGIPVENRTTGKDKEILDLISHLGYEEKEEGEDDGELNDKETGSK